MEPVKKDVKVKRPDVEKLRALLLQTSRPLTKIAREAGVSPNFLRYIRDNKVAAEPRPSKVKHVLDVLP